MIDTADFDDDQFKGNVIVRVALMAMKHYFMDDYKEKVPELLSLLSDLLEQRKTGIGFLAVLMRYLSTNKKSDKKWLKQQFINVFNKKEGEDIMESIADQWIEEGKEIGKLEETRNLLLQVLKVKFKNVSKSIENILKEIKDRNVLTNLHGDAVLAKNMNEFQHRLDACRSLSR